MWKILKIELKVEELSKASKTMSLIENFSFNKLWRLLLVRLFENATVCLIFVIILHTIRICDASLAWMMSFFLMAQNLNYLTILVLRRNALYAPHLLDQTWMCI